ncbi:hypothetical protein [Roseovarius rhodophyticola]|uniref:Uncharacterized protein n=1 Tax=Roseovarius rhodophyticola TaxID=3080827 RepID=A0ABZ2TGS1_9RHOB
MACRRDVRGTFDRIGLLGGNCLRRLWPAKHHTPATEANPNPQPDTDETTILALYQSAFTAWAALILLIPAYAYYLSQGANRGWLAFWTVSYLAYLVHLYVSAFLFFGGDFAWMTSSSRVSAFWPGMLLIPWWGWKLHWPSKVLRPDGCASNAGFCIWALSCCSLAAQQSRARR